VVDVMTYRQEGIDSGSTWNRTRESRWIWRTTFSEDSFSWRDSRRIWTLWHCTLPCRKKCMQRNSVACVALV